MHRVVEIFEKSYGPVHPQVAIALNNLATLLYVTNRLAEAEPLMRRALLILLKFSCVTGHEHPKLRKFFRNYWQLLEALSLDASQIEQRLTAVGQEAGIDADSWREWLEYINETQ